MTPGDGDGRLDREEYLRPESEALRAMIAAQTRTIDEIDLMAPIPNIPARGRLPARLGRPTWAERMTHAKGARR